MLAATSLDHPKAAVLHVLLEREAKSAKYVLF